MPPLHHAVTAFFGVIPVRIHQSKCPFAGDLKFTLRMYGASRFSGL
jgi:hypothetical protein